MSRIDGYTFWSKIDDLMDDRNLNYKELANLTGIEYRTITTQRSRMALPKVDQVVDMAAFFGVSLDSLFKSEEVLHPQIQRIERIRRACLVASDEDLALVERILRIDGSERRKFDFSLNPYNINK